MAEQVGSIYYSVTLDTSKMIDGQREVSRNLDQTAGSLDGFKAKLTSVASAVGVLAAAMATIKAARLADELRLLATKVSVAAGGLQEGAKAMSELEAMSRRTQTSVSANAEVFSRLNSSMKAMGGTQEDTLRLTETLAKAIKVSGASADEAKGAMLQFGQALGSGKLGGDELRSLMESSPYLMKQMADAIGVPVGALKKMGEAGELTADVVANAMTKAAAQIDSDFKKFPQTIDGAFAVAVDAAKRANKELDELTGTSLILTGGIKGLTDVLDSLAFQFSDANKEAGNLSKNDQIESWAESTKTVLSYVVDAADLIVRGFRQMGTAIGGLAAATALAARGEVAQSAEVLRQMYEDILAIGAPALAGSKIRDGIAAGKEFMGPMPQGQSTLKSPVGVGSCSKTKKSKFDDDSYMASLRKAQASEMGAVNEAEAESLRVAKKYLDEKKISQQQYAEAVTLITKDAEDKRIELMRKAQEHIDRDRLEADRKYKSEKEDRDRGRMAAREAIASTNPIDALRLEEEQRIAVIEEFRKQDIQNTQLYEDAKLAIKQDTAEKIKKVEDEIIANQIAAQLELIQGYGSLFGSIADLTKTFAGEQSSAYKAMFAVSKAFAIADATVKLGQAIMNANWSAPFPANFAAMASVASAGSAVISSIQGAQFGGGRLYGGPVSAGSLYRVNENGKPEMFTAANGNQYMLPSKSGRVTAANKVGSAGAVIHLSPTYHIGDGVSEGAVYAAVQMGNAQLKRDIIQTLQTMRVL